MCWFVSCGFYFFGEENLLWFDMILVAAYDQRDETDKLYKLTHKHINLSFWVLCIAKAMQGYVFFSN